MLKEERVTHVYVVGLAADFCVKATAEHAVDQGYETYIVEEATKPVLPDQWPACRHGLVAKGVKMVSLHGDEIARVKDSSVD
jgi:nicotinamidase-related amidase